MESDNFCGHQTGLCVIRITLVFLYLAIFTFQYKVISTNWQKQKPRNLQNIKSYTLRKKIILILLIILLNLGQGILIFMDKIPYSNLIPLGASLFVFLMMWNMLVQEHIHLSCTSKYLRSFTKLPISYFLVELGIFQFLDKQNKYCYFLTLGQLFLLIIFYDLIVNKPCNLQLSDLEKNYLKKSMTVHKIVSDVNTHEQPLLYDSPQFNQLSAEQHQTNKTYTEFQLIYYNQEYFQINYKYFLKQRTKTIKYTDLLLFIATIRIKYDNVVTQVLLELSYCKLRNNDTVEKMLEAIQKDEAIERDLGNFFESQDINTWCDDQNKTPSNLMDTFTNQNNFLEKSNTNPEFKLISVNFHEQQVEYEISNTLYKVNVQQMEEKSKQILRQSIDSQTSKLLN